MSRKMLDILTATFGDGILSTHSQCGDDTAVVSPTRLLEVCRYLRQEDETAFDQPIDVTCVDYRDYPLDSPEGCAFMVVYHLRSMKLGHRVRLKVPLSADNPEVDSVTPVWKGFNWFEREVFDMFGVRFRNHPDLRRILMYPEFVGHPLRKDYPLRGYQPTMPMPTVKGDPLPGRVDIEEEWPVQDPRTSAPPDIEKREILLQMGPSHPAMRGTVKMDLKLDGETVVDVDVHIGYVHRGFEKMCEQSTYNQCFAYADRLNYASPAINNVGLALTIEKLLGIEVPERAKYIRTVISEISRVQDHLTAIGATALGLGGVTAMLWCVEARDHYYHLFEELAGARVTLSYCRVGGLRGDLPAGFAARFARCAQKTERLMADVGALLTRNRLYMDRMCGIGTVSAAEAVEWGFTGPCLRASGVPHDVRKDHPYLVYDRVDFEVPVGERGDNYDRYLVRMEEIRQSIRIVDQCFEGMPEGPVSVDDRRVVHPPKEEVYGTIEGMIAQFSLVIKGSVAAPGEVYGYVEGGNGELGFYLVSDGSGGPYRLHVRAPGFAIMQAIPDMVRGHMPADIIPTLDSINMIGGEIDR